MSLEQDLAYELFSQQEIADRVADMGAAITADYAEAAEEGIVLICVLRGAAIFMGDLA